MKWLSPKHSLFNFLLPYLPNLNENFSFKWFFYKNFFLFNISRISFNTNDFQSANDLHDEDDP